MFTIDSIDRLTKSFDAYINNSFFENRGIDHYEGMQIIFESHAVTLDIDLNEEGVESKLQSLVDAVKTSATSQGLKHCDYLSKYLPRYMPV